MKVDLLYLLPALAVLICLTGAVFPRKRGGYIKAGRSAKQYSRDTVMTARFTVGALLLATMVTMLWPVQGVDRFLQGLFTALLFLIPLFAYHAIIWFQRTFRRKGKSGKTSRTRKRSRSYKRAPDIVEHSGSAHQSQRADANTHAGTTAAHANSASAPGGSTRVADTGQSFRSAEKKSESSSQPAGHDKDANRSAKMQHATKLNTVANRTRNGGMGTMDARPAQEQKQNRAETDVMEQMDRVSTLVKSYDLGDGKQSDKNRDSIDTSQQPLINSAVEDQTTDLASHNEQALQVSRTEALRKVVATLQDDKRKLQRLVIAQQAAFDSERQSHERTRHVARDAIKVMRDARSGQRMAEKIARRERAERRRLEKEYTKVTKALKNAMSTLANAEGQEAKAGKGSTSAA